MLGSATCSTFCNEHLFKVDDNRFNGLKVTAFKKKSKMAVAATFFRLDINFGVSDVIMMHYVRNIKQAVSAF